MRVFTIGNSGFVIPLAGVEALKWFGLVCMIQEHVFRYVFDAYPLPVYVLGRLAFPLFTFALAAAVPLTNEKFGALLVRLVMWGCVSEALRLPVILAGHDMNVLFTFALGLIVAQSVQMRWTGLAVALVCLALSSKVEYQLFGVMFVALMRLHFVTRNGWFLIAGAASLCVANQSPVPALAYLVAPVIAHHVQDVQRVRGFFYWAYAGQWPVIWGLRHVF